MEAQEFLCDLLITTEKDASKLRQESFEQPVLALRIEIDVKTGAEHIQRALEGTLHPRLSSPAGIVPEK